MSGNVPSIPESSLLWGIVRQWKLWIVAAVCMVLAAIMAIHTEGTLFHEVWFGLLAVGSVLYAIRRVGAVSVPD